MEYKIVRALKIEEMEPKVNQLLDDGWTLCGGVSTVIAGPVMAYYQTMTRKK